MKNVLFLVIMLYCVLWTLFPYRVVVGAEETATLEKTAMEAQKSNNIKDDERDHHVHVERRGEENNALSSREEEVMSYLNHLNLPPPPIVLLWFAPVVSGGGYSSEAVEFLSGLHTYLPNSVNDIEMLEEQFYKDEILKKKGMPNAPIDAASYSLTAEFNERKEGEGGDGETNDNDEGRERERNKKKRTKNDDDNVVGTLLRSDKEEKKDEEEESSRKGSIPPHHSFSSSVAYLGVAHHGDQVNYDVLTGWPKQRSEILDEHVIREIMEGPTRIVVVCHSEPGAWAFPRPKYDTTLCPPPWGTLSPVAKEEEALNQVVLKIGRTMFETDRLPEGWKQRLEQMDEVWVPSQFHFDVFTNVGKVNASKVYVLPESIDTQDLWNPEKYEEGEFFKKNEEASRLAFPQKYFQKIPKKEEEGKKEPLVVNSPTLRKFGLSALGSIDEFCAFKFLSIFKWEERKGWDVLLQAFYEEFQGQREHVCLIIKTSGYHSEIEDGEDEEYFDTIVNFFRKKFGARWKTKNRPRIRVLSQFIPLSEYPSLYRSVDCLVQPSRGEGWGRPHTEAMSMQLPVIATNWSGNTAYMKHGENSYLISVDRMSTISTGAFRGHQWAEPSVTHLKQLMRHVVDEKSKSSGELEEIRQNARRTMIENFDNVKVAKQILTRIDELLARKNVPTRKDWQNEREKRISAEKEKIIIGEKKSSSGSKEDEL